jgi:hypothetical protein
MESREDFSMTKIAWLKLFVETIASYSESYAKPIDTLCWQNAALMNVVARVVHIVTTVLSWGFAYFRGSRHLWTDSDWCTVYCVINPFSSFLLPSCVSLYLPSSALFLPSLLLSVVCFFLPVSFSASVLASFLHLVMCSFLYFVSHTSITNNDTNWRNEDEWVVAQLKLIMCMLTQQLCKIMNEKITMFVCM